MSDHSTRREDSGAGADATTRDIPRPADATTRESRADATTREPRADATTRESRGDATTRESRPRADATTRESRPRADATTREAAAAPATTRESAGGAGPADGVRAEDAGGLPQAVFSRYRPVRDLATGGEAHLVMLVSDRQTGEERVAKVYPTAVRPATSLLDALRSADPRHVVRVVDWGEEVRAYGAAMSWEVLEYAPGGSLAALARDAGGALPPEVVRVVVEQVTAALAYLHGDLRHGAAVGMAHRDIKPENILLRDRTPLDLVLCDFGLVAELRATRRTTGRAGTPAYQAPETWWQKSQEPEQDWWSLGVVVVELLTGRNPNSGVGGRAANERAVFEHIAKYGVDLDGITDPQWRLLCQGLLTRAPEERWGAAEVRAWLAGERPAVHDAPIAEPEPAPAQVAPFEVAGRLCRSPEQVGAAFAENWSTGIAFFSVRERQLDLSDWLRDNFPAVTLPENLMKTKVSGPVEAAARLTRFISWVAPEMPPVYEQRRADATGLAALAQQAAAGDPTATGLIENVDVGLLRALARHRCRIHPQCAGDQPGCTVLAEAADHFDQVRADVRERINDLAVRLAAGDTPTGWPAPPRQAEVDAALPVARAMAVRLLVDPDHRTRVPADLRKQKAPNRRPWWAALRAEAASGAGLRPLAAAAVAVALIPVATAETAAEQARQAAVKQERRNERAAQAGTAPARGRTVLRNAWRDFGNLMYAVLLAYLLTFAAAAANRFEEYALDQTRTADYLNYVTAIQTMVAAPILVVLGCLLIRPAEPRSAVRRARWFCWLFALAVAVIVQAEQAEYRALVRFPIVVRSGVYDTLGGLNRQIGDAFPYAVVGALILALWIGRRLVNRALGTEAGPGGRVDSAVRAWVLVLVAVLYLIQPLYVWQQWSPPFLPSPTEVWWLW
ncbi:protein kinase [Actinoplanes sp. DH11]|uniref:protein kinase domain-containing protein n=1 Tax=Actinoplanes sp. DH11 TaxID=2857011 RepID=UPI001E633ACA|nr:protein kinase [Actinoplanes sp. DH11]